MQMTPEGIAILDKLAPFVQRAKCCEKGREKLHRTQRTLAFILLAEDISENSRKEALRNFACPVYQALTGEEITRRFGLENAKLVGFRQGGLSSQLEAAFAGCRIMPEADAPKAQ